MAQSNLHPLPGGPLPHSTPCLPTHTARTTLSGCSGSGYGAAAQHRAWKIDSLFSSRGILFQVKLQHINSSMDSK